MKYSDQFCDWLLDEGFTSCFFVAGGNVMHILESASTRFTCTPVINEATAVIASEYFNESSRDSGKAFALVTAGPGITNALTGMAGAYLESRPVLVIGGQVKAEDLRDAGIRQRGIQEIDGVAMATPVAKTVVAIRKPLPRSRVIGAIRSGEIPRPGPVFIEFCLDAQSAPALTEEPYGQIAVGLPLANENDVDQVADMLRDAVRPLILLGGGVSREVARQGLDDLSQAGIPIATSWNAADRIPADFGLYAGRPNTWGMRWANFVQQEADTIVAIGARLGLQQTGFNWRAFAPRARVVQVDVDLAELYKGHPYIDLGISADANDFLLRLLARLNSSQSLGDSARDHERWRTYVSNLRRLLALSEEANQTRPGFVNPFDFVSWLSQMSTSTDVIVPCSSGGAFTVMMQAFEQKVDQTLITNKALASMGYGLAGAIGAASANPHRRVLLVEGDGGFAQNLQELGTVSANRLNVKAFVFSNDGYASIRMTQKSYFRGRYVGCDSSTGLGLPRWRELASAFDVPFAEMHSLADGAAVATLMDVPGPLLVCVSVDPEQTYFPKISSRVLPDGSMASSPLEEMTPALDDATRHAIERMRLERDHHE
jgi:acetolactate synthase-1/2/3 large subunit